MVAEQLPAPARPTRENTLIDAYVGRGVTVTALDELARTELAAVPTSGWYQKLYAADVELALAHAVRTTDPARSREVARRAVELLEAAIAQTGGAPGYIMRRLAWARAMASR